MLWIGFLRFNRTNEWLTRCKFELLVQHRNPIAGDRDAHFATHGDADSNERTALIEFQIYGCFVVGILRRPDFLDWVPVLAEGLGLVWLQPGEIRLVVSVGASHELDIRPATIAAVMIVWFALMVRKVLIVVSAVFAPLAFAGSLADITVSWTRKWIEIMIALIFSKLILVIIFIVGWGVLLSHVGQSGTGAGQGVTQVASGILILGVAGLAPWMALKLVHFSGDHFHQLHSMSGAASAGAAAAVSYPQKAPSIGSSAARMAGASPSVGA